MGVLSIKLEKILTKNLTLSILAGVLIIAGSFWLRLHPPASNTVDSLTDSNSQLTSNNLAAASTATPDPTQPSDNQDASILNSTNSSPNDSSQNPLDLPSGGTLSYDELKDKSLLYPDGEFKYSAKDLKTQTTNRATLLTYGLNILRALNGFPFYKTATPEEITFNIYSKKSGSENGLAQLKTVQAAYTSLATALSLIKVPTDLVKIHINLTNTADRISQLLGNMEKADSSTKTDNLLALNSARQYIEEEKFMIGILANLNSYFNSKNIDFGKDNIANISLTTVK